MPYLAEIVDLLNQELTDRMTDGARFILQLNGITELQPRNEEDQTTIPVLVNTRDWSTFSGIDDRFSVQVYHRIIDIKQVESPLSYGDGATNGREEATVRMVCFCDKQRTGLNQYDLAFTIRSSINKQYNTSALTALNGLLGVTVEATSDNLDGVSIWQDEYGLQPQDYPVRMHQCLFSIDYTITSDYNKSCITSCLEC